MESLIGLLIKQVESQLKEKGIDVNIGLTQDELIIKIGIPQNLKETFYRVFGQDIIIEPEVFEIKIKKKK